MEKNRIKSIKKGKLAAIAMMLMLVLVVGGLVNTQRHKITLTEEAASREKAAGEGGLITVPDITTPLAGNIPDDGSVESAAMNAAVLVNKERVAAGLPELSWSQGLKEAASVRAGELQTKFSHTRPDGSAWYTVNEALVYGENLAKGYNGSASVVDAWMKSPTHKANILSSQFTTIGISLVQGTDGVWYWAQEFG